MWCTTYRVVIAPRAFCEEGIVVEWKGGGAITRTTLPYLGNSRMLAKIFQASGVLLSVGGLIGDEILNQFEERIRNSISRATKLNWARSIIDWAIHLFSRVSKARESLISVYATTVFIIGAIIIFLINSFQEGQRNLVLYEAQRDNPELYNHSVLLVFAFMIGLLSIIVLVQRLQENSTLFNRIISGLGKFIRWIVTAYILVVELVIFGSVAIVLIPLILLGLVVGFIILLPIVAVLMIGFLIIRIALLPYQVLDKITLRLKLKSTVLFIGLIFEFIGIILD